MAILPPKATAEQIRCRIFSWAPDWFGAPCPQRVLYALVRACASEQQQVFEQYMDTQQQVLRILDEVLSLGGRSVSFDRGTHLLGAIPELDSMAVVSLITSLEEQLGIMVDDDEIDGETFATVGSLTDFVAAKLAA